MEFGKMADDRVTAEARTTMAFIRSGTFLTALVLAVAPLSAAHAQKKKPRGDQAAEPAKDGAKKDAEPESEFPRPSEATYTPRTFTRAEIQRVCAKYNGQVIAYYSDFWKVVNCERRPIVDAKTVYEHLRGGKKVLDADEEAIAALPEGEPLDWAMTKEAARGCKQLEGQYVTFSSVDVYFVERCKKRIFPDWATYLKHREQRTDKKGEIQSLSWIEFEQLAAGEPIPSIIDDIFAKLLRGDAGVEVIPVDEACEGVEGKITSYYSRLYRIERCRKREITTPEVYLKSLGVTGGRIVELRSEQWLSLPDGQPITSESRQVKPTGLQRR
jgi:hypothetical protein